MKTFRYITPLVAFVTLAMASNSLALPPRQHGARGTVSRIDPTARTFAITPDRESPPRVFVWKDYTTFRKDGERVAATDLRAGAEVKLYYRKEIGEFVPRSVTWKTARVDECCRR